MSAFDAQNRAQSSPDQPSSGTVSITVLSVTPARAQKLFSFASIEIDIDGVQIGVHGIRAMHAEPEAVAIELPKFRDGDGVWRTAITLPEEIYIPIARAVLDELVERGLAARPEEDDRRLLTAGLRRPNLKKGGAGLPPGKDSNE
jgi:stage V sporulation protein G